MIFYYQSSEGASNGDQLGQITLPQFRGIMQAAKVITARFPAEKVKGILSKLVCSGSGNIEDCPDQGHLRCRLMRSSPLL